MQNGSRQDAPNRISQMQKWPLGYRNGISRQICTFKEDLIPEEHRVVATIEESSDDTLSYVSVHINEDKSSLDEPEWQRVQPNFRHKKRMSIKERKDLNIVRRSEKSATEFAEGQNTVAEMAESFLRNL